MQRVVSQETCLASDNIPPNNFGRQINARTFFTQIFSSLTLMVNPKFVTKLGNFLLWNLSRQHTAISAWYNITWSKVKRFHSNNKNKNLFLFVKTVEIFSGAIKNLIFLFWRDVYQYSRELGNIVQY